MERCAIQTAITFLPPLPPSRAGAGARAQARTALKAMSRGRWREQWKGWQGAHDQMLPMEERLPREYCLRIPPSQRYGEGPRGQKGRKLSPSFSHQAPGLQAPSCTSALIASDPFFHLTWCLDQVRDQGKAARMRRRQGTVLQRQSR